MSGLVFVPLSASPSRVTPSSWSQTPQSLLPLPLTRRPRRSSGGSIGLRPPSPGGTLASSSVQAPRTPTPSVPPAPCFGPQERALPSRANAPSAWDSLPQAVSPAPFKAKFSAASSEKASSLARPGGCVSVSTGRGVWGLLPGAHTLIRDKKEKCQPGRGNQPPWHF